jgi:hypothetical protein
VTWLAAHLTAIAWLGGAWCLLMLHLAGALYRHITRTDTHEQEPTS